MYNLIFFYHNACLKNFSPGRVSQASLKFAGHLSVRVKRFNLSSAFIG